LHTFTKRGRLGSPQQNSDATLKTYLFFRNLNWVLKMTLKLDRTEQEILRRKYPSDEVSTRGLFHASQEGQQRGTRLGNRRSFCPTIHPSSHLFSPHSLILNFSELILYSEK
jgi:outer membrane translocation and assembly module TamA